MRPGEGQGEGGGARGKGDAAATVMSSSKRPRGGGLSRCSGAGLARGAWAVQAGHGLALQCAPSSSCAVCGVERTNASQK